jgi:hypothetical protein
MYQRSRKLIKQLDWDIGYDTPDQAEEVRTANLEKMD